MPSNIFRDLPEMETERLLLRKLKVSDAEDLFIFTSQPQVSEFLTWQPHRSVEDTRAFLETVIEKYENNQASQWGLYHKKDRLVIGTAGFVKYDPANRKAEIANVLSCYYWRQGLMFEAMEKVLRYGFEVMELNRIEGMIIPGNLASEANAKKMGLKYEGIIRDYAFVKGKFMDFASVSLLRKEYYGEE
ncbi:MAG: GNAT family N-acetyltransferase [Candidatus Krumholzibacteriota bacterium]|nr:GNAT family N-acetyltransferase [Candidatus Krumholzibacteriota bacterium]